MPIEPHDPKGLLYLLVAALIGATARLAKLASDGWPGAVRLFAGALGGAISGFSVGAIVSSYSTVPGEVVLAIGGIAGWFGGEMLDASARWVIKRFLG